MALLLSPRLLLRAHAVIVAIFICSTLSSVVAHPLGNFTINHFTRITPAQSQVRVRYVIDMAEIPAFQVMQQMAKDSNGKPTTDALNKYLEVVASQYAAGLKLMVDGKAIPLTIDAKSISTPQGSSALSTIRIECDFVGSAPFVQGDLARRFHFEDTNYSDRIGWHEIVVLPSANNHIFDSNAFGSAVTDELKTYPSDMLTAPLDERMADFSVTSAPLPAGAIALQTRDGRAAVTSRDRFTELISVPVLTPLLALIGLLIAAGLGALHALSPGHGKTVVGAYLVGSRGTPRHAVFLGLTVTVTHTIGVFALGVITLFASKYILPEQIFPILSFISGGIVLTLGLTLFVRRLRGILSPPGSHDIVVHSHEDSSHTHTHSHGGVEHSHLPPGADGNPVTWRSLLALGISGGLLPCPSALVVLLSAIALHRIGYGLLLVIAFSTGLATTLTVIGLLFVFAKRFFKRSITQSRTLQLLPVLSALVIAGAGAAICYEALGQTGFHASAIFGGLSGLDDASGWRSFGGLAILGLGLVFGLKHATEVDHIIAVSSIVSQHRSLTRSAAVGGWWGVGHTFSLVIVGLIVLALRVAIPDVVSSWLEFGVALMIIGLGVMAAVRALQRRSDAHFHSHSHDGAAHEHLHFHDAQTAHVAEDIPSHSHTLTQVGIKPLLVGAMHGLAGSGALTVLVLTQIHSALLGLVYLVVFGIGSIAGMLIMSFLVGLPFALTGKKLGTLHYGLQTAAGALSIAFGFWYAYRTGVASGLLGLKL